MLLQVAGQNEAESNQAGHEQHASNPFQLDSSLDPMLSQSDRGDAAYEERQYDNNHTNIQQDLLSRKRKLMVRM